MELGFTKDAKNNKISYYHQPNSRIHQTLDPSPTPFLTSFSFQFQPCSWNGSKQEGSLNIT